MIFRQSFKTYLDRYIIIGLWGFLSLGTLVAQDSDSALAVESHTIVQNFDEWSKLNPDKDYEAYSSEVTKGLVPSAEKGAMEWRELTSEEWQESALLPEYVPSSP
ncbi:MAG TPA: hypothetical protein EYO80_08675, partial [Candidatus Marinimicrobia bacterium]|nr:hypothetical protein [Candidatus Neomarinimicrobiota bacterium]